MKKLRSESWFGRQDMHGFMYRSWMKRDGWPHDLFDGRPVIGICNTWSELTPCNSHFREIAESCETRRVGGRRFSAGVSRHVVGRNSIAAYCHAFPKFGEHGCRRVYSWQSHRWRGLTYGMRQDHAVSTYGRCFVWPADHRRIRWPYAFWEISWARSRVRHWSLAIVASRFAPGEMKLDEFFEAESCMHRSQGHCMTMGTASTMASMVEALGMSLPGNAAIPAVDARRNTSRAQMTGRRIVQMVQKDLVHFTNPDREAFENAIRANAAIGGSTNAVIHLIAIAGRIGVPLSLDDFDRLGPRLCLCLVEPATLRQIPDGRFFLCRWFARRSSRIGCRQALLDRDALTVNGKSIWDNVKEAPCWNRDVIHRFR